MISPFLPVVLRKKQTLDDGSDGPESGDDDSNSGGSMGASKKSPAASAPNVSPYAWGPSDMPGGQAQDEQDLPPAYFSIAHGQAGGSDAGKEGRGVDKRVDEKGLVEDSRSGTDECSSAAALMAAPAVDPWASQAQPPLYMSAAQQLPAGQASSSGETASRS